MPWQQATIAWHPGRDFCIHKHFISFRKCKNQVCVCHETWQISIDAHFTCVQPQNAQGIPMNTHSHIHLLVIAELVRTDVWFLGKLPYYCSSVCVCALKLWIKMVMLFSSLSCYTLLWLTEFGDSRDMPELTPRSLEEGGKESENFCRNANLSILHTCTHAPLVPLESVLLRLEGDF